ncbi:hypothetical protein [Amycolatopsis sp. NPDC059021]|uniref:hypothetical protein n=1 Tax=Amycolatopsis sp. NPDC059021 TaxID=3346704 RepID=UPI003670446D
MDEIDLHVHIGKDLNGDAAVRGMVASTFGLAGDLPGVVTTGCGLRVPRAKTSALPERVTCLACREHAVREHLGRADQIERLAGLPGTDISGAHARSVADWHRERARKFTGS